MRTSFHHQSEALLVSLTETSSPAKWSMLRFSLLMLEAVTTDLVSPSA
jgi:hypothetical protein